MNGVETQFSFTNSKRFQATFKLQVALVVKSTFYRMPSRYNTGYLGGKGVHSNNFIQQANTIIRMITIMQSSFVPIMNWDKPLDLAKCDFKKYQ